MSLEEGELLDHSKELEDASSELPIASISKEIKTSWLES